MFKAYNSFMIHQFWISCVLSLQASWGKKSQQFKMTKLFYPFNQEKVIFELKNLNRKAISSNVIENTVNHNSSRTIATLWGKVTVIWACIN